MVPGRRAAFQGMAVFFEVLAHFSGCVQGVGFRYIARRIVSSHPVQGYARNLPDGRVCLRLQGEEEELRKVLASIQARMATYIEKVETEWSKPRERLDGFQILG